VGRDVEQIVRDLLEIAIAMTKERMKRAVQAKAELAAEERVIDALVGEAAGADTRSKFRKMLRSGELDDKQIELKVKDTSGGSMPTFEIPGMPGASMGMLNLNEVLGNALGGRTKNRKMSVADSYQVLIAEESESLLDQEKVLAEAIQATEQNGIVFIDEIDKICAAPSASAPTCPRRRAARPSAADRRHHGLDQARAGEDRPHPLHRLRRLPHRQALGPAARVAGPPADPRRAQRAHARRPEAHPDRARSQPHHAIQGLLGTEELALTFTDDAHRRHRRPRTEINGSVENIGARRLADRDGEAARRGELHGQREVRQRVHGGREHT
jgi:ATP-dependent HslUV protease ATP-binding subunit HslU